MSPNLMQRKSSITKRRLIIIYILCTILTVSVMTGFSKGLESDDTIYTANGERLVMWAELPNDGTPEDYDALTSIRYAAQKLYTSSYFKGESIGDVVANVGMGIKYSQHVHNVRVVKGKEIFQEAISSSALKSVADQLYFYDDNIFYRPASKINGDSAVFPQTVYKLSSDDYYSRYGAMPNELTKYAINPDTILEVADGNAVATYAASADDEATDDGVELYVPDSLTPDADGNYCVKLTLDPVESSKYYRNEVRTRGGADQNPVFYSVKLTLVMTSGFTPVSLTFDENYDIAIPGLGAMNCTSALTERFYDFDIDGEVPEHDFFAKHIDDTTSSVLPPEQIKSPADYLSSAFSAYIDGSEDLELRASVNIGGLETFGLGGDLNIPELYLAVDISTMDIRAKLGELYVQYANDKVYITKGDIKGYFTVDAFKQALASESVQKLLSGSVDLPDFGSLIGDDILDTVFTNCEFTTADGIACVHLPFSLGDIDIDASLYINDDDMSLISISGTVKAFGLDIALAAEPASCAFPTPDASYSDLSGLAGFIPDAIDTITGGAIEIKGDLSVADTNIELDLYTDLTDLSAPIVDGTVTVMGLDVSVKYADGNVYLQVGNIKLKTAISDISELIPLIAELAGSKLPNVDLKSLLPSGIDGWLAALRAIHATDDTLDVSLGLFGNIDLSLSRANGILGDISLDAQIDLPMLNDVLDVKLDVSMDRATAKTVAITGSYIDIKELIPAIEPVLAIVKQKGLSAGFDVKVGEFTLDGKLAVDLNDGLALELTTTLSGIDIGAVLIGDTVYASVGNIKLSATTADAKNIITALNGIIPGNIADTVNTVLGMLEGFGTKTSANAVSLDTINSALDAIQYISVDNGVMTVRVAVNDMEISAVVNTDVSAARVALDIDETNVVVALNDITAGAAITKPVSAEFVAAEKIVPLVAPVASLINAKGFSLKLSGDVLGIPLDGTLAVMLPTDETAFGLALDATLADVDVTATLVDDRLFLKLGNSIAIEASTKTNDLSALIQKLTDSIPELAELINGMPDFDIDGTKFALADIMDSIKAFDNTADGLKVTIDMTALGIDINAACELTFAADEATVVTVALSGKAFGIALDNISLTVGYSDETITSAALTYSEKASVTVDIENLDEQNVVAPADAAEYVSLDTLADLVAPIYALVTDAMSARTIDLDISATLLDDNNNAIVITGDMTVALTESGKLDGLKASLMLFAETENATSLDIVYTAKAIYIKLENILLTFDLDSDVERIVNVLDDYLPSYLVNEIGKLLGTVEGESAFGTSLPLIDSLKSLTKAQGASEIVGCLFDTTNGNSTLKTLLETVELVNSDNGIAIILNAMNMSFTVTPHDDGDTLTSLTIFSNLTAAMALSAEVSELAISSEATAIPAPANAAEYVSVMDLIELVNNLVHNFTTPDADGNITFKISDFHFDYSPKTITNEDGTTDKADRIIIDNTTGKNAITGKVKPIETTNAAGEKSTTYEFTLEAHIDLSIEFMLDTYGKLTLSLYVIDGTAYLDYQEGNTGYGERISLDFASVMQMACAVMQIMDVDPDVINSLMGDYKTEIDVSFFKSMKIAGLDSVKAMLEELADKIDGIETALADFNKAWEKIENAGTIDGLKAQWNDKTNEDGDVTEKGIKTSLLDTLATIKGLIPEKDKEETSTLDIPALIHGIATGVTLTKNGDDIKATVDNELTVPDTELEGSAIVEVKQSKHNGRILLDGFEIENLDVSSAVINGSATLFAGEAIDDIVLPSDFKTPPKNTSYSDFAEIKHLIFDVMNTASLKRFEINGKINLSIAGDIPFDVKVALIDHGENADVRYKTAAVVELRPSGFVLLPTGTPDLTTRLYFYDDNFYVEGVELKTSIIGTYNSKTDKRIHYTLDEFLGLFDDVKNEFLQHFLYYLIPMRDSLKNTIESNIPDSNSNKDNTNSATLAQIFGGYSYNDGTGEHSATVSLSALAGSSALGDLHLTLKGANNHDDEDNLLNNYITSIHVDTKLISILTIKLDGTLDNVVENKDANGNAVSISSKPLTTLNGYYMTADDVPSNVANAKYIFDYFGDSPVGGDSFMSTIKWQEYASI